MGSIVGKAMDDNMAKQQKFMTEMNQKMIERQIAMQNAMRERQMAMQIAKSRDLFHWWAAFYSIAFVGLVRGVVVQKKKSLMAPLLPLTFIVAYLGDAAYGSKIQRCRIAGEHIFEEESSMFSLPKGVPTFDEVESRAGKS